MSAISGTMGHINQEISLLHEDKLLQFGARLQRKIVGLLITFTHSILMFCSL